MPLNGWSECAAEAMAGISMDTRLLSMNTSIFLGTVSQTADNCQIPQLLRVFNVP